MIQINDNFTRLNPTYLFSEVAQRVAAYRNSNPGADIVSMGIGDVTRPVCQAATEAMHRAVCELADASTFHGYGPEQGYAFLRDAIARHDYHDRGIDISPDEIFVGDGAKSDTGNIGDILSPQCRIAVPDPVYPVYVDTNVMAGRAGELADGLWSRIEYLAATADNGFAPALPQTRPDVIYLCYPNNPTGTTLTRSQLQQWVDYARAEGALLLFDSAYEAYVRAGSDIPRSIYELEGAREVAIEFRSYSKTAGFTGIRCGYTVVPRTLMGTASDGSRVSLNRLWNRRQSTKFNGASYISQRAAEALYTPEGRSQTADTIGYYMHNAATLRRGLSEAGLTVYGGVDSPYLWVKTPGGASSWEYFDTLLRRANVVGTPGSGFGPSGEGYLRLTAFSTHEATDEAVRRIKALSAPQQRQ